MKWIKTMILPYVIYAFLMTIILLSYVGYLPVAWKIITIYSAGFILIGVLCFIPWTKKYILASQMYIKGRLKTYWGRKRAIGKCVLLIFLNLVVALVLERITSIIFYKNSDFYWGRYIVYYVILELVSLAIFYRNLLSEKIELGVMIVILSIGSIYVTAAPASCGVSWDDEVHYNNTMIISHFFDKSFSRADEYLLKTFPDTALEHKNYDRESQSKYYEKLDSLYRNDQPGLTVRMMPKYKNLCYVPGAVGLLLGRALHLPYHMIFMLGKWFNLLFYSILVYFALRKLKSGKMIVAVVALLPLNIFMASSYSYDPWITSWMLFGFCTFFGELQQPEKKMKVRDWVAMLLAFFIGVGPKVIYIPLILLTLFMPKDKYINKKQRKYMIIAVAVITCVVLADFMLPFLTSNGGSVQDTRGGSDVNASAQTAFIFGNPITYTKVLLGFLAKYFSFTFANSHMTKFHYFSSLQMTEYATLIIVLMMVVTFTDKNKTDCNVKILPRIVTAILAFGSMCLVATSMYIAFTSVGSNKIAGCQYRYLIPVMFPMLYIIGSGRIENHIKREYYNGIVLAICSYVLIRIVWTLTISIY